MYRLVRLLAAAAVFAAFTAGFAAGSRFPVPAAAAETLAKIQFLPAVLRFAFSGIAASGAAAAAIAALTLVFGRVYCAFLCPFGTLQDIVRHIARAASVIIGKKKPAPFRFRTEAVRTRFPVLAGAVVLLAAGTPSVLGLLEPYALYGKTAHDIGRSVAKPLAALLAGPLKAAGIFISPPGFAPGAAAAAFALFVVAALFAAAFTGGRLFCGVLCPAGSVLSLLSRRPLLRIRIDEGSCIRCGLCERVCIAGCIDAKNAAIREADCVRCGACLGVCPESALSWRTPGFPAGKRSVPGGGEKAAPGVSRSAFLRLLGAGLGAAGGFLRPPRAWTQASPAARAKPVLFFPRKLDPPVEIGGSLRESLAAAVPPGAGSVERFSSLCIACRLCESRCPTGVLRSALFTEGLFGIMQPVMDYEAGFCEYACVECGKACPTGAILPLEMRTKQKTQIGRSHLLKDRCVVYTRETACGACAEVCPTHAVHMVPYKPFLNQPETDESLCIGCGNCQFACPVEGTKAILVEGLSPHLAVDDRKDRPPKGTAKPETGQGGSDGEFPF